MFRLLETSVDRALTRMNNRIAVENENYKYQVSIRHLQFFFSLLLFRVNRSKGAPIILNVIGVERTDVKFSVDLVPSFKFEICHLQIACPELHRRIVSLMKQNNISVKVLMQYIEAKINVLVFRISWP